MSKTKKTTIEVQGTAVTVLDHAIDAYISLTDIANHKEPNRSDHVIQNWMRNRNTIEFLGVWERLKTGPGSTVLWRWKPELARDSSQGD